MAGSVFGAGCFGYGIGRAGGLSAEKNPSTRIAEELMVNGYVSSDAAKDKVLNIINNTINGSVFGAYLGVGGFVALSIPHIKRAQKRMRMYRRFARHSDLLWRILSDEAFKRQCDVTDWAAVAKTRKNAELAGLFASIGGVALSGAAKKVFLRKSILLLNGKKELPFILSAAFSAWALKPIITKAMSKKGPSVPQLEAFFEKAIARYEVGAALMKKSAQHEELVHGLADMHVQRAVAI